MMSFRTLLLAGLVLPALAACSPRENFRGAVLDENRLAQVEPGKTQGEVTQLLGSPSATSTFADRGNTWYYISRGTEAVAFLAEKVVNQRVVAVEFDGGGRVQNVRKYDIKDGEEVAFVDRETPTKGREMGIVEQFLGNLGRFNNNETKR